MQSKIYEIAVTENKSDILVSENNTETKRYSISIDNHEAKCSAFRFFGEICVPNRFGTENEMMLNTKRNGDGYAFTPNYTSQRSLDRDGKNEDKDACK